MSDFARAWASFRSRPPAEQRAIVRRAWQQLRESGPRAALRWMRQGGAAAREPDRYQDWYRLHTPDATALARMRIEAAGLGYQPLISLITAAYNTSPPLLEAAADSVIAQAYPTWEWHIADDGSTAASTVATLERIAARDLRIRVHRAAANGGTSTASNLALAHARGDYVALMDHDDALLPHAFFRVVACLNATEPPPDVVYSDEDKLDLHGARCDPYFKPDWSPDLFRSSMYACHLLVIRRALVNEAGGFRSEFDFSQDYDLLLRVSERTDRIAHVADVLYHWRKTAASTAMAGDAKPTAHQAGARALQAHLDRQAIPGRILDAGPPGLYRVRYDIVGQPLVTVLVVAPDQPSASLGRIVERLLSPGAYPGVELVMVSSDGGVPRSSGERPGRVQGVAAVPSERLGAIVNRGARAGTGDHLLLLRYDAVPRHDDWLAAMLELSQQPWIGAVGAKLLDARGRLSHIGLVLGTGHGVLRPFEGFAAETVGYYSGANCIRNYSAVSAACLMTRREVFDRVGGMSEELGASAAAIDYGLKVDAAGLRVVFTPYARLALAGSREADPSEAESASLRRAWGTRLDRDPYYNPHLSRTAGDYRLEISTGRR